MNPSVELCLLACPDHGCTETPLSFLHVSMSEGAQTLVLGVRPRLAVVGDEWGWDTGQGRLGQGRGPGAAPGSQAKRELCPTGGAVP